MKVIKLTEEDIQRMVQIVVEDYSPGDEVELSADNSDQDGDDIPDRLDSDDDNDGEVDEEIDFTQVKRHIKRFTDSIYNQKRYRRSGVGDGSYEIQKEIRRLVNTITQLNLNPSYKKRFFMELENMMRNYLTRVMDKRELFNIIREITKRIN
jgi:hypothetical protein